MTTPRKRRLRYSAKAVVRKEAELQNLSPDFSVVFFFNQLDRVISSAMVNGECWVQGIGTFKRTEFAARRRHNPRTGTVDLIPAGEKITFHPIKPRTTKPPIDAVEEPPAPRTRKRAAAPATSASGKASS